MNYKLKSVKLWATIVVFVVGTTLAILLLAPFKDWAKFAEFLVGFYFLGNVASKRKKPVTVNVVADPSVPPEDGNAFAIIDEGAPPYDKSN